MNPTLMDPIAHLEELRNQLEALLPLYEEEHRKAVEEQDAYDSLYGRAFLEATGSVEARKIIADQACRKQGLRPDISKGVVKRIEKRLSLLEAIAGFDQTLAKAERVVT